MADYTRDDALAFIEAMRLTVEGKVGFKWMSEKLSDLSLYVQRIAEENERLKERIEAASGETRRSHDNDGPATAP